jgi:hypothetical protein
MRRARIRAMDAALSAELRHLAYSTATRQVMPGKRQSASFVRRLGACRSLQLPLSSNAFWRDRLAWYDLGSRQTPPEPILATGCS